MPHNIIHKYFIDLSDIQKAQIQKLQPLYADWNSKINVISRKDMDNFYQHHVLHSLAIAKFIQEYKLGLYTKMRAADNTVKDFYQKNTNNVCVMDVGCGGGFPGIPLAIMFPAAKFLLIDSIGKKVKVAQAVAQELGLNNVATLHQRAEDVNLKEHFKKNVADLIVSRAVTSLDKFLPWIENKYTEGILCLKGGNIEQEITEAQHKCKISPARIFLQEISAWFSEEYFQQKKVVFIK